MVVQRDTTSETSIFTSWLAATKALRHWMNRGRKKRIFMKPPRNYACSAGRLIGVSFCSECSFMFAAKQTQLAFDRGF